MFLTIAFLLTGCDEDTGSLGVVPQNDAIATSTETFGILSSDMLNNVVPANSTTCYLGKVIDPEIDKAVTATFAAQFHTFEDYTFPDKANIVADDNGFLCDSIEVRLFLKSTFGDKNNPMKVEVWPLSKNEDKLIQESMSFFTNTDLWQFADTEQGPITTKVFTATDYALTDAQRASSTYLGNVRIVLPREYGENIMQTYYAHPEYFRNSYVFIRNVCPGFLFRTVGGTGTMLNLEVCTINLNFRYRSEAYPDSTLSALCRFAATPEVIQSTQFESSDLAALIDNEQYTLLKTPAGICTELTLPIDDIYRGHENDSIARASFTLSRINNQDKDALDDDYALGIPQKLLLVRKQNLQSFFQKHQVSDSQQSYTTFFSDTYNCYTFDNISRLISYCQHEKEASMEAEGIKEYKETCEKEYREEYKKAIYLRILLDERGLTELPDELKEVFEQAYEQPFAQQIVEQRFDEKEFEQAFSQEWRDRYKPIFSNKWNANHPDWNHVVLVPVNIATTVDSYGYTAEVSVNQDLSLCSTKLVRGTSSNPINMQVIYSQFSNQ